MDTHSSVSVLLFENDEISKNLFVRYLKRHAIDFQIASSFKEFLKLYSTWNYRACFFDIDVNVREEDLEKLSELVKIYKQKVNKKQRLFYLFSKELNK